MTPEERQAAEQSFEALRAIIEAYAEHNNALRAELRSSSLTHLLLVAVIITMALVRTC